MTTRSGQFVGKNTYSDTPDFMDDNGHGGSGAHAWHCRLMGRLADQPQAGLHGPEGLA